MAVATYWMQALDWAYATTDTTLAKAFVEPGCVECSRLIGIIDDVATREAHFQGGRISQTGMQFASTTGGPSDSTAIDLTYDQAPLLVIDRYGHRVGSDHGIANYVRRFWLRWTPRGWRIAMTKAVVAR